jgi:hypothetical protein
MGATLLQRLEGRRVPPEIEEADLQAGGLDALHVLRGVRGDRIVRRDLLRDEGRACQEATHDDGDGVIHRTLPSKRLASACPFGGPETPHYQVHFAIPVK